MKGDKQTNGLMKNAVMQLRGTIRTIRCHIESSTQDAGRDVPPLLPWLVDHAGNIRSRCQKGRDGRTTLERWHGQRPHQAFDPFGEKVPARPTSTDPLNKMNPRYKFGKCLGARNNSAECLAGTLEGVLRAREVRRQEQREWWDKEMSQHCAWHAMESRRRNINSGQTRSRCGPGATSIIPVDTVRCEGCLGHGDVKVAP